MARSWSLILIAGSALIACNGDDAESASALGDNACPERIRDTLGYEYGYDCDGFELSTLAESPEPPVCTGSEDIAVFRLRPSPGMPRICYFETVPGSSSGTTSATACRPVACAAREECPGGYPCVRGICRVEPQALTEDSAFALCLADIPWPAQCSFDAAHPDFADRIEPLLESCPDDGDSCTLPAECPQ